MDLTHMPPAKQAAKHPPKHESLFGDRIEGYEMLHTPVNEQGAT